MRISGYDRSIEKQMLDLFISLSEKDRRRYAAIEALKLGFGGIKYISNLFSCDEKTIQRGLRDLRSSESLQQESVRAAGAGRPSKLDLYENIDEKFLEIIKNHTAGSPMNSSLKWTNLSRKEIQERLAVTGIDVSRQIIKKLLHKHGYVKRKLQKKKPAVRTKIETNNFRGSTIYEKNTKERNAQ